MSNNNPYSSYEQQPRDRFPTLWTNQEDLSKATSACLARVFMRMFLALLVTAVVSYGLYAYEGSFAGYPSLQAFLLINPFMFFGIIIAQFAVVILLAARITKMSSTASNAIFFFYAMLTGVTLSVIFIAYPIGMIFQAFAVSALMFAAMAILGTITKTDLTKLGGIMIMGLIGLIIASFINVFFQNDTITAIINYIGVLVFLGLTAYDTQNIKRMLEHANSDAKDSVIVADRDEAIKRISVIGALKLYLDFINLFLHILRILARRR